MRSLAIVVVTVALVLSHAPAVSAAERDRLVFRATVAGDFIDTDSRHDRLWRQWPRRGKTIALGDLVHKNSPERLWAREWESRWGSLPTCKVWSVLGNHGWGWSRGRWSPPARGSTYLAHRGAFHRECPSVMRDRFQWAKRRPGWLLVGLNTEACWDAKRFLSQAVQRFPGRSVAVFTHRPPVLPPGSSAPPLNCPSLARAIAARADVVLSGHSHRFWRSGKFHVIGTVGDGKGWGRLSLYRSGGWRVTFARR